MNYIECGDPKMDIIMNMISSDDFKKLSTSNQIENFENLSKKIFSNQDGDELQDLIIYVINFITGRHIECRIVGSYFEELNNNLEIVIKMRTGGINWDCFKVLNESLSHFCSNNHKDSKNNLYHIFYFNVYKFPEIYKELIQ